MKSALLSVGISSWYPRGIDRLRASATRVGFKGELITWRNEYPPGSPIHRENLYAFKNYAFDEAARRSIDCCCWMDASCWCARTLDPMLEAIDKEGYAFFNSGWLTGQWTSDRTLPLFGITREQSFEIPMIAATCMGVNLKSEVGREFLRQFGIHARDGSFNGPATNENGQASSNPKVLGHRYDQSAASVIVHRMGLKITEPPMFFRYWINPLPPETCIVARGMRGDETPAEVEADLAIGGY